MTVHRLPSKAKEYDMLRITDKAFKYTSSVNTDLKKRFEQIIREQRAVAKAAKLSARPVTNSVVPIRGPNFV
jgi:uncharacterized membrane protein YgaE (UPF0421/DUF939 family)